MAGRGARSAGRAAGPGRRRAPCSGGWARPGPACACRGGPFGGARVRAAWAHVDTMSPCAMRDVASCAPSRGHSSGQACSPCHPPTPEGDGLCGRPAHRGNPAALFSDAQGSKTARRCAWPRDDERTAGIGRAAAPAARIVCPQVVSITTPLACRSRLRRQSRWQPTPLEKNRRGRLQTFGGWAAKPRVGRPQPETRLQWRWRWRGRALQRACRAEHRGALPQGLGAAGEAARPLRPPRRCRWGG
jgi:hypothetical protein